MYFTYLLGLFLLLGVNGDSSSAEISQTNENIDFRGARDEKFDWIGNGFALNSRQLDELEKTVNVLYKKYFGPPKVKLSLRTIDDGKSSLSRTISLIGEKICAQIKNIFKKFGLNISSRVASLKSNFNDTLSLRASVYYNLMRIPLEVKSIWQGIASKIGKQMRKNNYANMGYKASKFSLKNNEVYSERDFPISGTIRAIKNYSKHLQDCLEHSEKSSFDLKRAFRKLTNHGPEETGKILNKRLEKALPKISNMRNDEYDEIHALICHGISENSRREYRKCLREVRRVDKCARRDDFSQHGADHNNEESPDFLYRTIKTLDESCQRVPGKRGFSVECGRQTKMAQSDDFSYVTDFLIGDLKKMPALKSVTDELGESLRRSQLGAETLHEISTLIGIYQKGIEKSEKLLRMAGQDGPPRLQNSMMMRNISYYERHLAQTYFGMVNDVSRTTTSVEKIFFDGVEPDLPRELDHPEALRCLSELIALFYGDCENNHPIIPSRPPIFVPENKTMAESRREYSGLDGPILTPKAVAFTRSSHDEPLNKFIYSLKRLGENPPPRRPSSLISLANTFLLAMVFYECITVLAAAIYREESGPLPQNDSMENQHNDQWKSRNERTPFLIDYHNQIRHIEDESEPSSMTIDISKNSPTLYDDISQNDGNFHHLKMAQTIFPKKSKLSKKKII